MQMIPYTYMAKHPLVQHKTVVIAAQVGAVALVAMVFVALVAFADFRPVKYDAAAVALAGAASSTTAMTTGSTATNAGAVGAQSLDHAAYDLKLWQVAFATTTVPTFDVSASMVQGFSTLGIPWAIATAPVATTTATSITTATSATSTKAKTATKKIVVAKPQKSIWPAAGAPYPLGGAPLPFNRIVAYYGNFYSKGMGVLGQYPPAEALTRLQAAGAQWQAADPSTPVVLAIDYIAVTAQGSAGKDGKYRLRMPDSQIDQALSMAAQVHGIVILDVQVGLSDVQTEVPLLEKYLSMPNVHLALDPEFAMQTSGKKPGTVIGTLDASDINWAAKYLAGLVQKNNLPPKILVVHRFTQPMVTHASAITPLPEVEVVMDMDGWGSPTRKQGTYQAFIQSQPVQFTGFKLFYKNDIRPPSTRMLTTTEILHLKPQPLFIQYQ